MKTIKIFAIIAAIAVSCSAFSNNPGEPKKLNKQNTEVCSMNDGSCSSSTFDCTKGYTCKAFDMIKINDARVVEIIGESVLFPNLKEFKTEGMVVVEYHVELDGRVVVDQMNTSDPVLGEYVKNQIESLYMLTISGPDKKYYAQFNFKVL